MFGELSAPLLSTWMILIVAAFATSAQAGEETDRVNVYVSRGGRDDASGRSLEEPFASLKRALVEARRLRKSGGVRGVTIQVRAGRYPLAETLTIGPEDAGAKEAPLVLRGYRAEQPVLCGGPVLDGFRPYRGKMVECSVRPGLSFRQLFFRGERMPLARTPNADPEDIHGGVWAHVVAPWPRGSKRCFKYNPKEIDPSGWHHPQDARIGVFCRYDWRWNRLPVKEVSVKNQTLTLGRDATYALEIGDRYFVEGLLEELDAPGEWYLDRRTGTCYFYPPATLRPGDVTVPAVGDLLHFKDTHDVRVEGFVLEGCDGNAVRMDNSRRCRVARSIIRNCGDWGVTITGGTECAVVGCDVYATGRGGIALTGGDRSTLTPAEHVAANNVIHDVGVFEKTYNTAVNLTGVGNLVRNNLIYATPHAGLVLGGNDNVVEFNVIHHTNLQSTDTGGLYSCPRDWTQRGNLIRYNVWHHLGGYGKHSSWQPVRGGKVEFEYPHFTWGLYMDDPTSGNTMFGNVLYEVPLCALFTHGGRDNVFENNILVDCPAFQAGMLRPGWSEWKNVFKRFRAVTGPESPYFDRYPSLKEYRLDDGHPEAMTGHKFLRNIVYDTVAGTAWLRGEQKSAWKGAYRMLLYNLRMRAQDLAKNEIDYNCVFTEPGLEPFVSVHLPPQDAKQLSWEAWRKLGMDQHSVFADPKFVDAARHDYRLRPDSPALKLGFKPLPFDKIGPYQDELRVTWPVVEDPTLDRRARPLKQFFQLPGYEPLPAHEFVPRGGAGNVFAKLAAGKPVRIAYFGGGIHPPNGWRAQVLDWLRNRYPQSRIREINADICDCVRGSGFSVYRFGHDVLQQHPDLVLVDFASDDYQTDAVTIQRTMEGIVRQAWKTDPTLDLLFLYAFRAGFEDSYAGGLSPAAVSASERVARHYGVPAVNMGCAVAAESRAGRLVLTGDAPAGRESFSKDGVRPSKEGNRLYAQTIVRGLEQLAGSSRAAAHPLPDPLRTDNYETARLEPITRDMLTGDWQELPPADPLRKRFARHFDTLWFTRSPGARLTFTFTGTEASLFDLMGPDTGQVKVTVDGRDAGVHKQVDPWSYYQRLAAIPLAGGLPPGQHTLTVELLPDPPDRTVAIEAAKRKHRYEAKLFHGVALRLGWLRVR